MDERLERLRQKLAATDDPDLREALEDKIAALEREAAAEPPAAGDTITTGNISGSGIAIGAGARATVYIGGRPSRSDDQLLAGYLVRLRARCGAIPLEGMRQQKQVSDVFQIGLDQVYTQLTVPGSAPREAFAKADLRAFDIQAYIEQHTGDSLLPAQRRTFLRRPLTSAEQRAAKRDIAEQLPAEPGGRKGELRPRDTVDERLDGLNLDKFRKTIRAIDQLTVFGPRLATDAIADYTRLVLLGEPGSGKSTVLRYLALTLADAGLDNAIELSTRLAGWDQLGEQQRLLPIFLPLLPFARQLAAEPRHVASADDLWRYIADQLEPGDLRTGLAEAVHAELAAGRVLLLLDGLDEVAGAESRRQVVGAVAQFGREHKHCRMVVSCRVRAYEGAQNTAWQLPGWATTTLEPWDRAQMHHFVAAWYAAAVAAGGLPEAQCADRVAALQRAIAASGDLQRLADRLLLLTIMALVHLNDGRLPEDRVALYGRCVDILLGQWELRGKETSDYGALMDYLGLPDRDVQRLRPLLARAAFKAHAAGSADSPGVLGRETLRGMVADHLEQLGHPDPHRAAQKFLDYTDQRAGLLQASDAGDAYVFPHLTFQEYLAGLELTSGVGVVQRIMQHREHDRWRVPILLGVGDYVSGNKLELPYQLLRELLEAEDRNPARQARDLIFAAEIAADVGWDRLEHGGATFKRLRRDLAQALAPVVEGSALPAAERVHAGALLGALGDPRAGVCGLPPAMVPVIGGSFQIGSTPEELEIAMVLFERTYTEPDKEQMRRAYRNVFGRELQGYSIDIASLEIGRYPVTNAQFAQFIAADGYHSEKPWWDSAGRAWLVRDDATTPDLLSWQRRERKDQPSLWDDEQFGSMRPNHPVVGVNWYEAVAFCRWLTQTLNDGFVYTLPSEAEWEYAARGTQRRMFPWGPDEPDDERANYEQRHQGTTAVGCFSLGATPEGVHDLAGNVWEWTRSEYRSYPYDPDDRRESLDGSVGKQFTLRGGGWDDPPIHLRASARGINSPDYRTYFVGFRLARHSPV